MSRLSSLSQRPVGTGSPCPYSLLPVKRGQGVKRRSVKLLAIVIRDPYRANRSLLVLAEPHKVRQQVGLPDPRRRGNLKDHAALLMEGFVGDKVKVEIGHESGTHGSLMIRSPLAPCRLLSAHQPAQPVGGPCWCGCVAVGQVSLTMRSVLILLCGIEIVADQCAKLEQPFDLRLHQGRFSPFQLRRVPLHRYGGGTSVRGTPVRSRRKCTVKFGVRSGSRRYKSWLLKAGRTSRHARLQTSIVQIPWQLR